MRDRDDTTSKVGRDKRLGDGEQPTARAGIAGRLRRGRILRRRRRFSDVPAAVLAAAVVAAAVAAGIAAAATLPAHDQRDATASAARPGPPGGNRDEALAAGNRALAAIVLPAGSRRLSGRPLPKPLQQLPFGRTAGLVGPYRAYRIPVPMPAAAHYLHAHLATGLVSGGISRASLVSGPTIMLSVTSDLQRPPAGIAELQLYEDVVPGQQGSSLLLAQALVTWYPPRSAEEYLTAARFRLIRITADPMQGAPVTVTTAKRAVAVALTDALNRMPAVPGGLPHSCPPMVLTYRLVLVPAVRSQPAVVVDANSCEADTVSVGGIVQPRLQDIGNTVYQLTAALLRR